MNKRIYHTLSFLFIISSFTVLSFSGNVLGQGLQLGSTDTILTTDINESINTDNGNSTIGDPIREGAYNIVHSSDGSYQLSGIINSNQEIVDHDTALTGTLNIIKNIINYALGLLSLIALIYLIAHGFMMLTAAGDDARYKKGIDGIKHAGIAIGGIGLSWFIISFIFWVIENISTS